MKSENGPETSGANRVPVSMFGVEIEAGNPQIP